MKELFDWINAGDNAEMSAGTMATCQVVAGDGTEYPIYRFSMLLEQWVTEKENEFR